MAVTKIWPVKGFLSGVLKYAADESKTAAPDLTGLQNLLDYAANESKTTRDQQCFVSGVNCSVWTAREQMTMTKKRFGKEGGIVAFHAYQSFLPGEVTPEQCHAIGLELAQKVWPGYEIIVATHLNTECCHNHFVINSVSFETGKRLGSRWEDYRRLRNTSDELCRQHGLNVVKHPEASSPPRNIYMAEKNGEPTAHNVMRADIDDAIAQACSFEHFAFVLIHQGYLVRYGDGCKYATIAMPSGKPVRFKTLGEQYTEEAIEDRIFGQTVRRTYHPQPTQAQRWERQKFYRMLCQTSGLLRLYLYYCWLLGKRPQNTRYRPLHPALREECYKILKRPKAEDVTEVRQRRNDLSEQITALRKEIKIAEGIPERIVLMERNIQMEEGLQERQTGRKLAVEGRACE